MHSLYFKNFLMTAALVLLSFLLLVGAFISVGRSIFVDQVQDDMRESAAEVAHTASVYARTGDLQSFGLRMMLASISGATHRHIFLTSADGYVVSCSDRLGSCRHIAKRLDPTVLAALQSDTPYSSFGTLSGFYEEEHYVVAAPFTVDRQIAGYVFVGQNSASALYAWKAILPLFAIICMSVLFIAVILSLVSSRRMAKPLKDLAEAARKFGHGDFTVRVEDTERVDELGELTDAFNSMAASLEQSEEQRRDFVANVSHELKTPMTTISGFVDGILDGTIPPERERKYLETISSETKRLARLVRSMLELSRLQAEDRTMLCRKSFDIAETLRLTLIGFGDKISAHGLDVDFQVPESAIEVLGDKDAITQVVYNLLDNAIKFARSGTVIGISLWKDSSKAYVSVRNVGATIPESEIPLLFDRFHKSDRSRSRDRDGVGLGLYIVKTILNNHGEDIAVTSREGVTDFVFTLTLK